MGRGIRLFALLIGKIIPRNHLIAAMVKKLLFLCSQNKLRSPTAEAIFSQYERLEVESAGLNHDAEVPLSVEMLEQADIIFVMEKAHRNKLSKKFKPYLKGQRIICLNIPDEYDYMDVNLIKILKNKVLPLLGSY
jgi:predicted protein tyrosine phosphatase